MSFAATAVAREGRRGLQAVTVQLAGAVERGLGWALDSLL